MAAAMTDSTISPTAIKLIMYAHYITQRTFGGHIYIYNDTTNSQLVYYLSVVTGTNFVCRRIGHTSIVKYVRAAADDVTVCV